MLSGEKNNKNWIIFAKVNEQVCMEEQKHDRFMSKTRRDQQLHESGMFVHEEIRV